MNIVIIDYPPIQPQQPNKEVQQLLERIREFHRKER